MRKILLTFLLVTFSLASGYSSIIYYPSGYAGYDYKIRKNYQFFAIYNHSLRESFFAGIQERLSIYSDISLLLRNNFSHICNSNYTGINALVCFIYQGHLYIANCGDSKVVLCTKNTSFNIKFEPINEPVVHDRTICGDDEFLIMGTSSFWQYVSNQEAVDLLKIGTFLNHSFDDINNELVKRAVTRGAQDHVVVILIKLN